MEPQRVGRREMRPLSSPSVTWRLAGGLVRGGLVYVHETGARAYVHVDDAGDLDVAEWDAGRERHFPDREALEVIIENDLQRMDPAVLRVVGIDEFRTVRSYRGRKRKRDPEALGQLLQAVERDGVRDAAEQLGLSERRVRELRREAQSARSPNEQADWHRASWLELVRKRRMLQTNWERSEREP
jgi:hypothetical protein